MSASRLWTSGALHELSRQECRELLQSHPVGRVAFVTGEGPVVLPVNFLLVRDAVVFRTSAHGSVGRQIDGRRAAFEVDEIDEFTQSGWSVLVRGTASFVDSVDDLPEEDRPSSWAQGVRSLFVRIPLEDVTGRRLLPA